MKRILLLSIALLLVNVCFAQEKDEANDIISLHKESNDSFVKYEFLEEISITTSLKVIPVIKTDMRSGEKDPYVTVKMYPKINNGKTVWISFIDNDELLACIESLNYISQEEITSEPDVSVDTYFKTRNGLLLGASYEYIGYNDWQMIVCHSKYLEPAIQQYPISKLKDLIKALETSRELLEKRSGIALQ